MEKIHMWDIISLLGIPYPSSGQSSYYVQCPCCDENPRKKHLNINLKKEVFRCPRCGASGGIFDLYALYTGTHSRAVGIGFIFAHEATVSHRGVVWSFFIIPFGRR